MRASMRGALWLSLAIALSAVAGCAGEEASDTAGHFTPGVTTRAQAIAALGPPDSVYDAADGSRTLTWAHNGGLFNPSETHGVSVQFGPDNVMIRTVDDGRPKPSAP